MKILKVIGVVVLVALIATVAYGVVLVRRGFSAQAEPSALEKVVARHVRNMAIPSDARTLNNPWRDKFTPDVMAYSRHHFADQCATCHANDASGQGAEMGQGLYPKPPDMRLPATQNLTDGELYYIIENGVRLTGMPAWGDSDSTRPNQEQQISRPGVVGSESNPARFDKRKKNQRVRRPQSLSPQKVSHPPRAMTGAAQNRDRRRLYFEGKNTKIS